MRTVSIAMNARKKCLPRDRKPGEQLVHALPANSSPRDEPYSSYRIATLTRMRSEMVSMVQALSSASTARCPAAGTKPSR